MWRKLSAKSPFSSKERKILGYVIDEEIRLLKGEYQFSAGVENMLLGLVNERHFDEVMEFRLSLSLYDGYVCFS